MVWPRTEPSCCFERGLGVWVRRAWEEEMHSPAWLPRPPCNLSPPFLPTPQGTAGLGAGTWSQQSGDWGKRLPLQASVKQGPVAPTSPSRCEDQ